MLEVKNFTVRYQSKSVDADSKVAISNLSFSLKPRQWLMITGPNGAGKTTVINGLSGALPYEGDVLLYGKEIKSFKPKELAKQIGVLTQNCYSNYNFTVEEIVRMGRYPYKKGFFSLPDSDGTEITEKAIKDAGLKDLKNRSILKLSGGELQRTFLARLFSQNPKLLILDEPANHLDLIFQKEIFELIKTWLLESDRAVITVIHDLALARFYGTDAILLNKGEVVSIGNTESVLNRKNLENVYGKDVIEWTKEIHSIWQNI